MGNTKMKLGKATKKKGFLITGVAICNVCLKPCKVWMDTEKDKIKSQCCKVTIVHRNVMLKFKREDLQN